MRKNISRIIRGMSAVAAAVILAVGVIPAAGAAAAEPDLITFWQEEEFTGAKTEVDLAGVKAGSALPSFASGFRNWEIRIDGSMDLVYATRPGQSWSQEMIDYLSEFIRAGYELVGFPSHFNITESNNSWPAASAGEIAASAGKYSENIIYFIFGSDRNNADFDVLELDFRNIAAGDPLPEPAAGRSAWKFQTAEGDDITATVSKTWTQDLIDSLKKAIGEGKGVAATDFRYTGGFPDVNDPSNVIYKPVYWASDNKIVNGFSNGNFGPNENCTRAQFAIMLWRMTGKPAAVAGAKAFSDVSSSMSIYKAVNWAAGEGIVNGYNDGTFGPDNNLTRRQIVIMLWRFVGKPDPDKGASFSDVRKSESSYNAISWASSNGIVKGFSDGSFKPDENCTRAQIVIILYRAVKNGLFAVN